MYVHYADDLNRYRCSKGTAFVVYLMSASSGYGNKSKVTRTEQFPYVLRLDLERTKDKFEFKPGSSIIGYITNPWSFGFHALVVLLDANVRSNSIWYSLHMGSGCFPSGLSYGELPAEASRWSPLAAKRLRSIAKSTIDDNQMVAEKSSQNQARTEPSCSYRPSYLEIELIQWCSPNSDTWLIKKNEIGDNRKFEYLFPPRKVFFLFSFSFSQYLI